MLQFKSKLGAGYTCSSWLSLISWRMYGTWSFHMNKDIDIDTHIDMVQMYMHI
jgi:hypothetical protein